MIAFHVLCHGALDQVAQQVESMYHRRHVYLIDIDNGQSPNTKPLRELAKRPNVHIRQDGLIGWGGAGTLRKTLDGALALLDLDDRWRYYVVLSGQDMPLQPLSEIEERLSLRETEGVSYIECYPDSPARQTDEVPERYRSSVHVQDKGHTQIYTDIGTVRYHAWERNRWHVDVTELAGWGSQAKVYVRNADPLLMRFRQSFFETYPYHYGANWFTLHRSALEHLEQDPLAFEIYHALRTTFFPDECFFQTWIMNSPFRDTVENTHQRLILRPGPIPDVKIFDMNDWPVIRDTEALFGRKFDARRDRKLFRQVIEHVKAA